MKLIGASHGTDLSPILLKLVQSPISDGNPLAQFRACAPDIPFQEKPPSPNCCRPVRIEENPKASIDTVCLMQECNYCFCSNFVSLESYSACLALLKFQF
jgi:hypothetical protein